MDMPIATIVSADSQHAVVEVEPAALCARCAAGRGCGAGLLANTRAARRLEVSVAPGLALQQGERVYLTLEPANLLQAALLAYATPLAGMALTLVTASVLLGPVGDVAGIVAAIVGLAGGWFIGRSILRRHTCLRRLVPAVHARAGADATDAN